MSDTMYVLIHGNAESMKKAFPKNSQFYEMEQVLTDAPKLYGLAFWVEKYEPLHPMVQAAMMIPGSWDLKTDLHIVNEDMAEFGKPEDRRKGKGLHIDRYATAKDINAELSGFNMKIVNL